MLILKEVGELAANFPYLKGIAGTALQLVKIKEVCLSVTGKCHKPKIDYGYRKTFRILRLAGPSETNYRRISISYGS